MQSGARSLAQRIMRRQPSRGASPSAVQPEPTPAPSRGPALTVGSRVRIHSLAAPYDHFNGSIGVVTKLFGDDKCGVEAVDGSWKQKLRSKHLHPEEAEGSANNALANLAAIQPKVTQHGDDLAGALASAAKAAR